MAADWGAMLLPFRRTRLKFPGLSTLAALAVALSASSAGAQTGVLANRFDPSEKGSDWFTNESLDYQSDYRPAFGVIIDYAKDPVVLSMADGSNAHPLISDQLYLHAGVSMAFWNRLRLGLSLPLELGETGNGVTLSSGAYTSPTGAAAGDLRLGADVRLLGAYQSPFTAAIGAQVYLPTGSNAHFTTANDVRVVPRIMIAGDLESFTYAVRFGYQAGPGDSSWLGQSTGSQFVMGAAVGLRFADKNLTVGPELSSYTLASNAFKATTTPTEVLFGAHYRIEEIKIGAGVGTSFNPGMAYGSPDFRMLLGLEWHPSVPELAPPVDRDQDGIPDEFDACPDTPGPFADLTQTNGCPPDRDHDGIADDVDACPDTPGVKTDDPKTNGCPPPPPDRDHDGILDNVDACPDVAGVKTDDPKTNGCPPAPVDPDRDKDGIPNDVDACPDAAGPPNDDPKKNGCPLARVENGQIRISEQVKFAENSARILKDSDTVLGAVLGILQQHSEITRLRVEGYTDSVGKVDYNRKLSEQRAGAVKAWLVLHKIEAKRVDSVGFGPEHPIDDNSSEVGRKNNRRVEFHIGGEGASYAAQPKKP
jgi:outer membrane protein OmpA-like peptidoglycan-associated protein